MDYSTKFVQLHTAVASRTGATMWASVCFLFVEASAVTTPDLDDLPYHFLLSIDFPSHLLSRCCCCISAWNTSLIQLSSDCYCTVFADTLALIHPRGSATRDSLLAPRTQSQLVSRQNTCVDWINRMSAGACRIGFLGSQKSDFEMTQSVLKFAPA